MTKEDQVRRMHAVEQMLKLDVHTEGWEALRLALRDAMENAKTDEGTVRAKNMLGLLNDLRAIWERILTDGKVARDDITREQAEKKRRWPFSA